MADKTRSLASSSPSGAERPLIGMRELAGWLGVSEGSVKRWVAAGPESGKVPRMIRVNGQIRFRISDVEDWLEENEVA